MKLSPMWSIYRQTQSNAVSFFYLKNRVCYSAPSWPVMALHVSFRTTPPPLRHVSLCGNLSYIKVDTSRSSSDRASQCCGGDGGGGEEGENARQDEGFFCAVLARAERGDRRSTGGLSSDEWVRVFYPSLARRVPLHPIFLFGCAREVVDSTLCL